MGHRGWKGERVMRMLGNVGFHLHTFVQGFDKQYTCTNNGRSEPKQMDYKATTAPRRWITRAKRAEYDATPSDHYPLTLSLLRKSGLDRSLRESFPSKIKPIGWQLTEPTYNDDIRVRMGMEAPV